MSDQSNQERVWVLGAFATVGVIAIACIVGSVFSAAGIGPILAFGGLITATVVNTLTNKLAAIKADMNAKVLVDRTQENQVATESHLEHIAGISANTLKMGETNHTLLNSARGELLEALLESKIIIAETRGTEADKEAVLQARKRLEEHKAGQATVDAAAGKPPVMPQPLRRGVTPPVLPTPSASSTVKAAQDTARDAQATAKDAQAVAKNLTEGTK